jgi:hypothetical protein
MYICSVHSSFILFLVFFSRLANGWVGRERDILKMNISLLLLILSLVLLMFWFLANGGERD